ncbi:MAG: class II fructose-bisphosphate aldolase [Firmicutes bacterium]|nr:class II fructose-bisphosphate aldolase [Bacillota bacterium]
MGPVTLSEILSMARPGVAIAAFNFTNLEDLRGIMAAAELEQAPVIIQTTETTVKHSGLEYLAAMGRAAARVAGVPVCLHLDHATDFNLVVRAIRLGYSSVMIDGSRLPFEENVAVTAEAVRVAHAVGVSVEAELGQVGGKEDCACSTCCSTDGELHLVDVDEAVEFVRRTNIDALAPAVGTMHGIYKAPPCIRFDLIEEVHRATGLPLVLHGGSGLPRAIVREAIVRGVRKFNVATDLQAAYVAAWRKALANSEENIDSRRAGAHSMEAVCKAAREKIRMCMGEER